MYYLAQSLNNLSLCLSDVGRHKEALEITSPLSFESDRREEAFQAIYNAISMYCSLADEHPAEFHPGLAQSPSNLSSVPFGLDRIPGALQAIHEAVNLFRPLATERSTAFSRKLARSLSILSRYNSDMGYYEDALRARKEAEDLDK